MEGRPTLALLLALSGNTQALGREINGEEHKASAPCKPGPAIFETFWGVRVLQSRPWVPEWALGLLQGRGSEPNPAP